MKCFAIPALLLSLLVLTGCETTSGDGKASAFGKTFYLDGAGNWGFGASEVPQGLRDAGYRGNVEIYIWTTSFTPLIDQWNIPAAKLRASALARRIKQYRKKYPDNELNIIALSAGTGVAIWAVEELDQDTHINNLILLGSSLSHDYDAAKALTNMDGKIYTYHSPHDLILEGVRVFGTIDGKRGVDSAGLVGLKPPPGMQQRVKNIEWSRRYAQYGWTGSHTDCTTRKFVRSILAKHVVELNTDLQNSRTPAPRRSARLTRHQPAIPAVDQD